MNKADIVKELAARLGTSQREAESIATTVLDALVTIADNEGVARFGSHKFSRKDRPARLGRNPQTGEAIEIPAKSVVQYKQLGQ